MSEGIFIAWVMAGTAALAAIIGAVITGAVARRNARDANEVNEFKETVTGMKLLIEAQKARIDQQERRIEDLEKAQELVHKALVEEQSQHAATRDLLRIAMRHIRDMISWLGSDRVSDPPAVPDELTHQLL